jgi:hypothetical protein
MMRQPLNIFLPLILVLTSLVAKAQDDDDRLLSNALDRRTIIRKDTLYLFYVAPEDRVVKPDPKKIYYWFNKDTILTTMGNFGGRVLDGAFKSYYPGKSLKESGLFRFGLKDGEWTSWFPDGSLERVVYWKKGEEKGMDQYKAPRKKKKAKAETPTDQ